MTTSDVITKCDRIKPNEYSYGQKREWLNKIESEIRQYASMYSGKNADLSYTNVENPVLFLDDIYMDIYLYYIISMIDLSNQEYALYNNSSSFYNDRLRNWQKKYRRENMPECNVSINL
ncbi:MAG: hypothetical protein E7394_00130 [Ruminococcaceae bacterium]|nr:hypothetical protein [Oscillospiraceae bacterium]